MKMASLEERTEPLNRGAQIEELAQLLRQSKIISFDTEFIRENTFFPVVEILQVADDRRSWLVDLQAFRGSAEGRKALAPLLEVLTDPGILKVVHAAQGDQECLATAFGVTASPIFDTAVGASLCGYGDAIGLASLLKSLLNVQLKKGHARTNWSVRPLPSQLQEYAHADVEHLVAAAGKLLQELDELGRREWAMELSRRFEDPALYDSDPVQIAERLARGGKLDLKGYGALIELVRWRESRVRSLNLPRRWVADDQVLVDLAIVKPKDLDHLGTFRGLNKGEIKQSGAAILEAIRRGVENSKQNTLPTRQSRDVPSDAEEQVLDLLQCYVGILADENEIAVKHLLTSSQLLPLYRARNSRVEDWVDQGLISAGAARLIGEPVRAFLQGRKALFIRENKVQILDVPG
jgi:ribonuclease D